MKYTLFSLLLAAKITLAQLQVTDLKVENRTTPIGLSEFSPRFSWKIVSPARNVMQQAYEIRVARSLADLKQGKLLWQSKKNGDQSVHVPFEGKPLDSDTRFFWQVTVWDNHGKSGSANGWWKSGLRKEDWKSEWISPGYPEDSLKPRSPLLRKSFSLSKRLSAAVLYITSLGLYEAHINGRRVGEFYLTPGWTSYNNRVQYQAYDVLPHLQTGKNAIGVVLGSGWYRGYIGFSGQKNFYGKEVAVKTQLHLTYSDGSRELIVSDDSWRSSTGAILDSEIYHGETIDANQEQRGWTQANFDDSKWHPVKVKRDVTTDIVGTYNEPIEKHETFRPIKIFTTPRGEQVIDFGQNLVGWVMMKVQGRAGDTVRLYHAEVLDKAGNFYTENLRPAKQLNTYILSGNGEEFFEPHFTFQGFRYVKVDGYPGKLHPENFTAVALYSDMRQTGTFTSSHPLLNQLQKNIQWGQKGNFLDVPTDCPQRDERLGWTGDAQVFARTAAFNMHVYNFFSKWLKDLALDQQPNGSVPFVVPNVLGPGAGGSAGWADAATIIPWTMYTVYGDKKILEEQYESMKSWVHYMETNSTKKLWNKGFHFGDWLSYMQDNDLMGRSAITDKYLIAQCFFAHSTQLVVNAANVLGRQEDVFRYTRSLDSIKAAFLAEYVTGNGRLVSGTQTAYVLALHFDMLPESLRRQAVDRLVQNIKEYNNHLSTGFLGTPYLCHVLSRFGYTDVAYTLLMQETFPSWLYPVKMGATTIWERWNGIRPDSTFEPPSMNSFNHYAYGAIGDWMYRVVAGIDTDSAGYKTILIRPNPGGGLASAQAEYESNYGKIRSAWKIENGVLTLDADVPANTTAKIYLPSASADVVREGGRYITGSREIRVAGVEKGHVILKVGSGKYQFSVPAGKEPAFAFPRNF